VDPNPLPQFWGEGRGRGSDGICERLKSRFAVPDMRIKGLLKGEEIGQDIVWKK
jgi:hypothetical protein